ncbi:MAG TPA: hypothetical protein VFB80_13165 [Pirellulaceae bacterium]|nr:hypothetical protein [Pirellulaceae bacterium]
MKWTSWLVILAVLGLSMPLAAQDAPRRKAAAAAKGDEPIDFARARELRRKQQSGEKLTAEEEAFLKTAVAARQAKGGQPGRPAIAEAEKTGFKPLTEMTADDRYKGQDGGLYGQGRNSPPDELKKAAEVELKKIVPLDKDGKPAASGTIAFISISMSNATQEFSTFKPLADRDAAKSPRVTIVDCAQGGQAMAEWVDPSANPWQVASQRLVSAGVSPQQVQVAWVKLANKGPRGDLQEHGAKLQKDTTAVLQNAKTKFPNLRIVYLGSRIYGGYTGGPLNPEPYAYEGAFVVRWLIQDQMKGSAALNYDAAKGDVKAPLLLWGAYFWGDGVTPRKSDGLVWKREDFAGDGTHPSQSGREKVARMILDFCKSEELAKPWFTGK